ncbi:amyloid beta A4 precursor protein-binding family B member 1-interacting protein-like isoform X2 [Ictalurus punctatus]|uniref:Amyloid beta A4 precursor protein-binding family B member 1-interacting protein-like isoform X2 n=2 Tax=Ictalurus punctatus TaxID=7998 RepID=A0A9F7TJ67_ICTPU|nr:amyloid beta A4 precursor protein-binding family B member 1-interacting protein-like isoform X2 [Ictalurus punctatus]
MDIWGVRMPPMLVEYFATLRQQSEDYQAALRKQQDARNYLGFNLPPMFMQDYAMLRQQEEESRYKGEFVFSTETQPWTDRVTSELEPELHEVGSPAELQQRVSGEALAPGFGVRVPVKSQVPKVPAKPRVPEVQIKPRVPEFTFRPTDPNDQMPLTHRQAPLTPQSADTHRQAPLTPQSADTHRQAPLTPQSADTHRQAPLTPQSADTHRQAPPMPQSADTASQALPMPKVHIVTSEPQPPRSAEVVAQPPRSAEVVAQPPRSAEVVAQPACSMATRVPPLLLRGDPHSSPWPHGGLLSAFQFSWGRRAAFMLCRGNISASLCHCRSRPAS